MTEQRRGFALFCGYLSCCFVGLVLLVVGRFVFGDNWNALTTAGFVVLILGACLSVMSAVLALRAFRRSMRNWT